ncbi:Mu transposase C-terminal domain-containing protein [Rhodococcus sp. NPDC059968]|uniref:Mu transposase C-terminal domain-containing protein n=1 Tax=Rhodococcus sp. NPDC059968 TaxID=3347017 RepID=UPI00366BF367
MSTPGRGRADPMTVLRPHLEHGVPLTRAAAAGGVSVRTARRWLAAYRAGGPAALARRPRADRGTRTLPNECVELVEGLALRRPQPSTAHIHRTVTTIAAQRGWPAPSYETVRTIVGGLDPGLATLAHQGATAYRDRFELVYRREAARPNEVWQADHTELDLMILDAAGTPVRPWLTTILDDRSRAVAGYTVFLGDPSTLQTALALRQAIWRKTDPRWAVCGLPDVLYSDHGADFTSAHLDQVCADTRIRLVHSTPGVPQGRGKVERLFGTVTTELLPRLPGHIPHGTHGKPVTAPTLTLAEADAAIGEFIVDTYHRRAHSETGVPPQQRWLAGGWLPRMPDLLEQLDLLLLTVTRPRVVHRDGIHCHGLRYLDLTLSAYVGERVTVRYDPRDLAEIRIYYRDQFLCRAVCAELADATISLKDLQRARTQRRRELRGTLTSRRSLADALTTTGAGPIPDTAQLTPRDRGAADSDHDRPAPQRPRRRLKTYRED